MPVLGVLYFDHDGLYENEPFTDKDTLKAYTLFSGYAAGKGLRTVIGKPESYHDGRFEWAWDLRTGEKVRDVGLDICWDRCVVQFVEEHPQMLKLLGEIAGRMPVVNHPDLVKVSEDKYETARLFRDYVPQTFLDTELEEARRAFPGRVVIKPRYGSHGTDVHVLDISEVKELKKDFIIQPFLDSSCGIPGIIGGVHDLRVTMLNDTIVDTYVRYPQTGWLSNISRGGKMKMVEKDILPEAVKKIVQDVDTRFSTHAPRLYSIDFMYDGERFWIIELNKAPGIWGHIATGVPEETFERICTEIADAFSRSVQSARA